MKVACLQQQANLQQTEIDQVMVEAKVILDD